VSLNKKSYQIVNLANLQTAIDNKKLSDKATVTKEVLLKAGLINKASGLVKILANGNLKASLKIEADIASQKAIELVKKSGGEVILISKKKDEKAA
ncbi:uL15 family ribosomal protein, partial [Rickettsiales bacterium]|nr:uL15 family ribosomal protein [Rickettsiales bacterium]